MTELTGFPGLKQLPQLHPQQCKAIVRALEKGLHDHGFTDAPPAPLLSLYARRQ